jgi:hypothetical protein
MDEPIVTFGLLMGMEVDNEQNNGAGDSGKEALLVFCPTGESEEGKIDITPRMMDLALMGFWPVVITRWNPENTRYYAIFAKEGLSQMMGNAVLKETGSLVREALGVSELPNYSSTDNNSN